MRARTLALLLVTAAIAADFSGCSGGGGGIPTPLASPTPGPSPTPTVTPPPGAVVEIEPNDIALGNPPTAISGTGAQLFWGVCANDNDFDYFAFTAGTGMVAAQISWSEGAALDDLDILIEDTAFNHFVKDDAVPPGDSPAMVQAVFSTSGSIRLFLEIDCYNTTPNVAYSGQLTKN